MNENFLKLLQQLEAGLNGAEQARIEVGMLSEEQKQVMETLEAEKARMEDKIQLKIKELELRFRRETKAAIEPIQAEYREKHKAFWNEVYADLGLDPKQGYSADFKTGKVYQYVDVPAADSTMLQ